jgi:hypothetical protein
MRHKICKKGFFENAGWEENLKKFIVNFDGDIEENDEDMKGEISKYENMLKVNMINFWRRFLKIFTKNCEIIKNTIWVNIFLRFSLNFIYFFVLNGGVPV